MRKLIALMLVTMFAGAVVAAPADTSQDPSHIKPRSVRV